MQKFLRMSSDFKKLFTGPGKNYIILYIFFRSVHVFIRINRHAPIHVYSIGPVSAVVNAGLLDR